MVEDILMQQSIWNAFESSTKDLQFVTYAVQFPQAVCTIADNQFFVFDRDRARLCFYDTHGTFLRAEACLFFAQFCVSRITSVASNDYNIIYIAYDSCIYALDDTFRPIKRFGDELHGSARPV